MRILTAGISALEKEKFKDSSNYDIDKAYYLNKPRGFIWGSTLIKRDGKAYSDWIRFVENEYNGIYLIRSARRVNIELLKSKVYNKSFGMERKYKLLL